MVGLASWLAIVAVLDSPAGESENAEGREKKTKQKQTLVKFRFFCFWLGETQNTLVKYSRDRPDFKDVMKKVFN